jgi:branched-chain amino acid transport system ATP-binding protein
MTERRDSPEDGITVSCAQQHHPHKSRTLLRAVGLKISFDAQTVLNNVDVELRSGEVVLLRGENGSGKTTLLNILTGNLEPDSGIIHYEVGSTRTYHFPRRWWQELNPWDHFRPEYVTREGIGRTWQDIRLFTRQTLRDNIAVAFPNQLGENPFLALLSLGRIGNITTQTNSRADAIIARLGLTGREESSADMVSLGQAKRVAIARAVAAGARILFLDEPLAGLDREGIRDVLHLLGSLVLEQGITLVIVEHVFSQEHLRELVTTDWHLKGGRIKVGKPTHDRKHNQSSCVESSSYLAQHPQWIRLLAGNDTEVIEELLPRGASLTRLRPSGRRENPGEPILEIRDLVIKLGRRTVIGLDADHVEEGFTLTLFEDEIVFLQAPNGWGKSTLFAAITGSIPIERGEIRLCGQSLKGLPEWERIGKGLRVLPSAKPTFPSLTIKEYFRLAGMTSIPGWLAEVAHRPSSSLSGGQKQRMALEGMGVGSLNLYDEPLIGLDSPDPFVRQCTRDISVHMASLVLMPNTLG